MKIVVAESVTCGAEAFETLGEVILRPEADICANDLTGVDALVTRSKTKITADLIKGTSLQFYGTCTAGTDHIDFAACAERDIHVASAAGCNANAVSEYVTAALLHFTDAHDPDLSPLDTLPSLTIGIVGHGHVGKRVEEKAKAFGLNVLLNDPPLQAQETAQGHSQAASTYVPLDTLLTQSDIITLHIPLDQYPDYPTRHLLDADALRLVKPGSFLINACRGEVIDSDALLQKNPFKAIILDVFEPEPAYPFDLFNIADFGTPHIAGHSFEGKLNGTILIYNQLCDHLGIKPKWDPAPHLAPDPGAPLKLPPHPEIALCDAVHSGYHFLQDHQILADSLHESDEIRAAVFTHRRRNYPRRREFPAIAIDASALDRETTSLLQALGFRT